jgi:hypothetical protein
MFAGFLVKGEKRLRLCKVGSGEGGREKGQNPIDGDVRKENGAGTRQSLQVLVQQ